MSKKKNTLKDLDEFLKQQAASLVPPSPVNVPLSPQVESKEPAPVESTATQIQPHRPEDMKQSREAFYDRILQTVQSYDDRTAEDKMLINTVLYLKNGERWKEAIREYWRTHS